MINLNLLYSFYVCAEHLNISKAAAVLGLSQPSLSVQIKNLEEQVGSSLFLRNGKSISLTKKGRELLSTAGAFYELREDISRLSEVEAPRSKKSVRILVSNEIERPFVAEVVAKLSRRERVPMSILASSTEEALSSADDGDIVLTHEKIDTKIGHVKVDFPVFFATSIRTPERPAFNDPSNIQKIIEYFGEDLIIPSLDTKLGEEFESFRKKNKIRKDIILESNIVSCLVRFVASGAGCAFLPLPYIKSSLYHNHIQLIGPQQGFWKHSIYIYSHLAKKDLETHPLVKSIRTYGTL